MSGKKPLRSQLSYGAHDKDGFIHRSWMKSQGLPDDVFDGRPVIGICNTWSELTPCNAGLREIADHVKRGVWEAGGLPLEFPVMSLGETQMRPTAMLFRNLLSMDVEESLRGNPVDGVVLLGGCDKTTPGQLMGAASVDLPTLVVSAGPMLNGKHRGRNIGSGTDVWKFSEAVRAGRMPLHEFMAAERGMSRGPGTCMTMGSASTMACLVEAMGIALPYNGTTPAVDAHRRLIAHESGRLIVELVQRDMRLSQLLTRAAFRQRDPCTGRHRRLKQRRAAPARHCRAPRCSSVLAGLRQPDNRRPPAGGPPAFGPLPDGRIPLCRRAASGHERAGSIARSHGAVGGDGHHRRSLSRCRMLRPQGRADTDRAGKADFRHMGAAGQSVPGRCGNEAQRRQCHAVPAPRAPP